MSKKRKSTQKRIIEEIKTQLITQAERWGNKAYYTQLKLEEMELDQCKRILGDLLSEKNNLEYEMAMLGTDKKEVLIKTERLETYIKKANRIIDAHNKNIGKIINKEIGDRAAIGRAASKLGMIPAISVRIGD
jgi:hypothetical protein